MIKDGISKSNSKLGMPKLKCNSEKENPKLKCSFSQQNLIKIPISLRRTPNKQKAINSNFYPSLYSKHDSYLFSNTPSKNHSITPSEQRKMIVLLNRGVNNYNESQCETESKSNNDAITLFESFNNNQERNVRQFGLNNKREQYLIQYKKAILDRLKKIEDTQNGVTKVIAHCFNDYICQDNQSNAHIDQQFGFFNCEEKAKLNSLLCNKQLMSIQLRKKRIIKKNVDNNNNDKDDNLKINCLPVINSNRHEKSNVVF